MKQSIYAVLSGLALSATIAISAFAGSDDVVVENAWARASIGTSRPGAAYLEIRNSGDEAIALIGLKTEIAMMSEVHRTSTDVNGVSSMAPAGEIEISPGETVQLKPGGLHGMLMKLKRPMKKGDSFVLILVFADGGELPVQVPVLGVAARGPDG
jgi:periplasmic copper chaperone A